MKEERRRRRKKKKKRKRKKRRRWKNECSFFVEVFLGGRCEIWCRS